MKIAASAPGKLVVSGEYAVLIGAPALVLALDRRIHVHLADGTADWHFESHGFADAVRYSLDTLLASPELIATDPAFTVKHVLDALRSGGHAVTRLPKHLDVQIDSTAGFEHGRKLGIGTSAGVCVAVTAALLARLDASSSDSVLPIAMSAHSAAQGGHGSGLDVASAWAGGLIRFERAHAEQPRIDRLAWPDGVAALAIGTRESADTPTFLKRFEAWRANATPAALESLTRAARATAGTLPDGRAFMRELRRFAAQLFALDEVAGLGIYSDSHRRIADLAPASVVYKPCGAGGGDLGLACSHDVAALSAFGAAASDAGFLTLPLEFEQDGVKVSITR